MKQLPGAGRGGMPVLPLKTALALAGHVRDVPIFLQIGSYTASLGLGLCLGKKKNKKIWVHFPLLFLLQRTEHA